MPEDDESGPGLKVRRYRDQRTARVDHILRRILKNGMASLCKEEFDYLDRASAELRYELGMGGSPEHEE